MHRRKLRLSLVCAAAVLLAGAALVLFVRPPRPVLRLIVEKSSGWLMAEQADSSAKRLVRIYTNAALASYIAEDISQKPGHDEEILLRMMSRVRKSVVSIREDWIYSVANWPVLISGVGFCDQVNGAVCSVAAQYFPRAELVALYDPATQDSPHTIGRVWSNEHQGWLYFDTFYREAVIFTRGADGRVRFLYKGEDQKSRREIAPANIYSLDGWKLAVFPRTFARYLFTRVSDRVLPVSIAERLSPGPMPTQQSPRATVSAPPATVSAPPATVSAPPATASAPTMSQVPETSNVDAATGPTSTSAWVFTAGSGRMLSEPPPIKVWSIPPPAHVDDDLYRRVVRSYAKARVSHLFGKPDRNAYRQVATDASAAGDDRALEIAMAARRFAERPEL